jgi:hypothetical protein
MVTTGAKLWVGITAFTLIAAVVYALASGGEWLGTFVLGSFAAGAAMLAYATITTRDGDVAGDDSTAAVPVRRALPAPWPALAGVAMGFAVVGLATGSALWWVGLVLAAVVIAEWMVQSWAERATGDHAYNQALRNRMMYPFEFPVVAAVIVGFVVIGFSRVLLALPKTGSWVLAGIVAALILAVAFLITSRPKLSSSVLTGVLAIGAVAVLAGGIVGAVVGEREFHPHEEAHDTEDPGADGSQSAGDDDVEGGPQDDPVTDEVPDEVEESGGEDIPDARDEVEGDDEDTEDESSETGQAPQEQTENPDGGEQDPDDTTEVSAP